MESGIVYDWHLSGGASDRLIKAHSTSHRLKVILLLEAKNMAIVLKDMVVQCDHNGDDGDTNAPAAYTKDRTMKNITTGALSYN